MGDLKAEEMQLSATVLIGDANVKATVDTGATASFISKELADRLQAAGKVGPTKRQVRMADGRCGDVKSQLEIQIGLGTRKVSMELLILPGLIDELVLGWNFLTKIGAEVKCAGHRVMIPARDRHRGWLEEKLSVAVVEAAKEFSEKDVDQFLKTELESLENLQGTSNVAPVKQRYYPKNPKMQGEINAKVDELLEKGCIEPSRSPYSSPIVMVRKKTGKWRLCVDFRQINAKSVKDAYPMPMINYILDQLREAKYISSLDLKDGYWQIPLEANTLPSEEEDPGADATEIAEVVAISSDESGPEDASEEEEEGTETVSPEVSSDEDDVARRAAREDLPRADTTVGRAQRVGSYIGGAGGHCPPMGGPAGGEECSSRRVAAEAEEAALAAAVGSAAAAGNAAAATATTFADATTTAATTIAVTAATLTITTTIVAAEAAGVAPATSAGRASTADHRGGRAAVASADGHVDVARARGGSRGGQDARGHRSHRVAAPTAAEPERYRVKVAGRRVRVFKAQ
ncbi:uncharacterized protein LOC128265524 [Drosophila gunungcola]|uniref:uncharacterized protein LOC128265524 n=1 Tax=Drosophila gunungcola TaxID=103775 RepID=UPI0022E773DA|nr:uncharacterized protein LOC128265524 [Drosophila gunungcola]